jgi:hypothetical protein
MPRQYATVGLALLSIAAYVIGAEANSAVLVVLGAVGAVLLASLALLAATPKVKP